MTGQKAQDAQSQSGVSNRFRSLKICAGGLIGFALFLLLPFVILFARVMLCSFDPPKSQRASKAILERAAIIAQKPRSSDTVVSAAHDTTSTNTLVKLQYKSFISDTSTLPVELKDKRIALNANFNRVLQKIEDYERSSGKWDYVRGKQCLEQVTAEFDAIGRELNNIAKNYDNLPRPVNGWWYFDGWLREVADWREEFELWKDAAWIDLCTREKLWKDAAVWSEKYLEASRLHWAHHVMWRQMYEFGWKQPEQPDSSDYFRINGAQDWERAVAYYRQAGGWHSYLRIAQLVGDRQGEWNRDVFNRVLEERLHLIHSPVSTHSAAERSQPERKQ
jgi:hypothetical protein